MRESKQENDLHHTRGTTAFDGTCNRFCITSIFASEHGTDIRNITLHLLMQHVKSKQDANPHEMNIRVKV